MDIFIVVVQLFINTAISANIYMYVTYTFWWQVLPEKRSGVGAAMMGSAHTYDVGGGKKMTAEGIEVRQS